MEKQTSEQKNREWLIDGIRGIAALVVVVEHCLKHFFPVAEVDYVVVAPGAHWWEYLTLPPFNVFANGAAAVSLFFVLSGYVLAGSVLRQGNAYPLTTKLIGRYLRLALPVTASLLLLYLCAQTLGYDGSALMAATGSMERPAPIETLTLQSALTTGLIGSMFFMGHMLNAPLWTITYEVLGSFLVITSLWCAIRFEIRARLRLFFYFVASAFLLNTFLIGFVLGAAIADLRYANKIPIVRFRMPLLCVLMLVGVLLLSFGLRGMYSSPYAVFLPASMPTLAKYTINALGAACILLVCLSVQAASVNMGNAWIRGVAVWLGKLSFPVYLVHYPLLSVVGAKVFFGVFTLVGMLDAANPIIDVRYWISAASAIYVSLLVTFIVAELFSKYIDIPSITFSKQLHKAKLYSHESAA